MKQTQTGKKKRTLASSSPTLTRRSAGQRRIEARYWWPCCVVGVVGGEFVGWVGCRSSGERTRHIIIIITSHGRKERTGSEVERTFKSRTMPRFLDTCTRPTAPLSPAIYVW